MHGLCPKGEVGKRWSITTSSRPRFCGFGANAGSAFLAAETPGRVPGRKPRDPEKERLLAQMDRARLAREGLLHRRAPQRDA